MVIVGFANFDTDNKKLFEYENIKAEAHERTVKNINPYLIESDDIVILNRKKPISNIPEMISGSMPTDGGNFILTEEEKNEAIEKEPFIEKYIKPYVGAHDVLNNKIRFCLWLVDANPQDIKSSKFITNRVEKVKEFRLSSSAKTTREYKYHTLFRQVMQPKTDYLMVPSHTSENREYIPFIFMDNNSIVNKSSFVIPNKVTSPVMFTNSFVNLLQSLSKTFSTLLSC